MEKVKLDIIGLSPSQAQSISFALVLGESNGKRKLPIIIGMYEAQAIALERERIIPSRPMTHDLFKPFANCFAIDIKEVVISDLKEGIFFAKITCINKEGMEVSIDARPSDAIAIGMRFDAEIYASERVMEEAGIVVTDEFEEELDIKASEERKVEKIIKEKKEKKHSIKELNKMLKKAIAEEDYEKAAMLRDELNRRN